MTPTRLIFIPAAADLAAPMLHVDGDGAVTEAGRLALENAADFRPMRTVVIVPGADVVLRRLDLPPGSAAQMRAAALWSLRDELAASPERLTAALGPAEPGREGRLVAVTTSALLQAWRDYLSTLGVRPDALVPDYLALPEPTDPEATVTRVLGGDVAVRTRDGAATLQPDLIDGVIAGPRIELDDAGWRAGLARIAAAPPINLLEADGRAQGRSGRRILVAGGLAGALVLSPLLLDAAAGLRDRLAASAADRRAAAVVQRADPALARDPRGAERLIVRGDAALPNGALGAAAALFKAVEGVEGSEIDALSAEAGRGLSATVSYAAFQDLDRLKAAMQAAGYLLEDESTVEDAGRVVSGVRVRGL